MEGTKPLQKTDLIHPGSAGISWDIYPGATNYTQYIMEIVTTNTPAKLAGKHISTLIEQHNGDVVCLLSGGSALDLVGHITEPKNKSECRTIFMMGDERGSRDDEINNSLQLVKKYPHSYAAENLVLTVPIASEHLEDFSARISETFSTLISTLKNVKVIQVLGVGLDGHTAGIFPLANDDFTRTYGRHDLDIVPVHLEGLTIDSRASFTSHWILSKTDELIVYITGQTKKLLLESLINETKDLHERPAELIKQHTRSTVYTNLSVEPK